MLQSVCCRGYFLRTPPDDDDDDELDELRDGGGLDGRDELELEGAAELDEVRDGGGDELRDGGLDGRDGGDDRDGGGFDGRDGASTRVGLSTRLTKAPER